MKHPSVRSLTELDAVILGGAFDLEKSRLMDCVVEGMAGCSCKTEGEHRARLARASELGIVRASKPPARQIAE